MAFYEDLKGKVAIITGAAQGLGEAIARELAHSGAKVVITDVQAEAGQALADELGGLFFEQDVADEARWSEVVDGVAKTLGGIDILVNNAGLIQFAPIEEMPVEQFDLLMKVNVHGTWLGCKAVIPHMKTRGKGSIINMSSMNGFVSSYVGQTAYATSKGAVLMLTKAVAVDVADYHIRVNSLHPGTIASTFVAPYLADPIWHARLIEPTLMKRAGESVEVARVAAFLASDDSSYMTGSEVKVDGGFTTV